MKTSLNVEEIRTVLEGTGGQLLVKYGQGPAPADREAMIARFVEANSWAEKNIRSILESRYPDIPWSEAELDADQQREPEFGGTYWVLDPVDGAVHLHQGFAFWSTSLCLIEEGQPVFAAVYDANRREFFHAMRGKGAFLNGERMAVAQKTKLADALLVTAPPNKVEKEPENVRLTAWSTGKLLPETTAIRMLGSVALQMAYVACGRMDAYWEHGQEVYDWMAGALLIEEAGGIATDMDGKPFGWGASGVIAGSRELCRGITVVLGY
ncbi:inositol monophosphatase family protein [Paenibacillus cineris]|uniref:Inositol monophosphatase n=1 Tax=Paenibacillus cineris TaxID=237530 RepID=A0ABQ4LHN9_9BACL|nr:inositol monophosphatase family protein [Paenibacillus cineris]GIO56043.1 inositol monophosphatase [Paenibacillus cineris]